MARAQKNTGARIHAVAFLSTHFHMLASFDTVHQMAAFMGQLKSNLSSEVGYLYDWPGTLWDSRYKSIAISEEPAAQLQRLRYVLSQGCKEGLVKSPRDWPGIHCAQPLIDGCDLEGVWINRTSFHRAKERGMKKELGDFEEAMRLTLEALPCFRQEAACHWRRFVAEMVEEIERETLERHRREGTAPAGVTAIYRAHPWQKSKILETSPAPLAHAFARNVRLAMVEAYRQFLAVYRVAAQRLAAGDRGADFPENCFPPRLSFVWPRSPEPG